VAVGSGTRRSSDPQRDRGDQGIGRDRAVKKQQRLSCGRDPARLRERTEPLAQTVGV